MYPIKLIEYMVLLCMIFQCMLSQRIYKNTFVFVMFVICDTFFPFWLNLGQTGLNNVHQEQNSYLDIVLGY